MSCPVDMLTFSARFMPVIRDSLVPLVRDSAHAARVQILSSSDNNTHTVLSFGLSVPIKHNYTAPRRTRCRSHSNLRILFGTSRRKSVISSTCSPRRTYMTSLGFRVPFQRHHPHLPHDFSVFLSLRYLQHSYSVVYFIVG